MKILRPVQDLGLLALLLLSFGLRLLFLADMEWNYDEKIAFEKAGALLHCDRLPLVGLDSSVGIPNPPGFIVLIALLRLVSWSPLGVAAWIACLNAAAIVWLAVFLRPRLGRGIAWTTAFLMATAPWAVIFSRKIWAQDLLAPFAIALLIGLVKAVEERHPRYWLLVFGSLFFLLQLHLSSVFLVLAIPLVVVAYERPGYSPGRLVMWLKTRFTRDDWRYILWGSGVCVLLFAPYVLLLLKNATHAMASIRASQIADMTFSAHAGESLRSLIQVFTGYYFETTLYEELDAYRAFCGAPLWFLIQITSTVAVLLFSMGVVVCLRRIGKEFLPLYTVVLVAGHLLYLLFVSTRTGAPYFLILYPLPFLLMAWGLALIRVKGLGKTLAVCLVIVNALTTLTFLGFIHQHGGTSQGYGVPYRLQDPGLR